MSGQVHIQMRTQRAAREVVELLGELVKGYMRSGNLLVDQDAATQLLRKLAEHTAVDPAGNLVIASS